MQPPSSELLINLGYEWIYYNIRGECSNNDSLSGRGGWWVREHSWAKEMRTRCQGINPDTMI